MSLSARWGALLAGVSSERSRGVRVFLGLGSNLGERRENLERAILAIAALDSTRLICRAGLYESAPVGPEQPDFLNTAVGIETGLDLLALLDSCKAIESRLGRVPSFRWGPRLIDIDLLIADAVHQSERLTVPHKELHRRRFALQPLCELAGEFIHPVIGRRLDEICAALPDQGVRRLAAGRGDIQSAT